MSSITTTSSTLLRPYIGSRRNRQYIPNKFSSSSLFSNDYYFSTISLSKSFLPNQFRHRSYLSDRVTIDALQERVPTDYSPISLGERQLHQGQNAKDFLSSSFPTSLTYYDRSSSSFIEEQQKLRDEQQHSYWQPNKNNHSLFSDQQNPKHSLINNHYIDQNNTLGEKNSCSSPSILNDTTTVNNNSDNQFHLLTSTPILPSFSPHHPTTSNSRFALLSSNENNNSKLLPTTSNNIFDRSSTTSALTLTTDSHDVCQLSNMSGLRFSPGLASNPSTKKHSYDQRISDQGNKYIIQLKTDDYQENEFTITPHYYQNQLIIDAKHNEEDTSGGYIRRELHKIFLIPKHIDLNKHTHSYNKNTQELTIEMPYLQSISNEIKTDSSMISPNQNSTQSLTFSYGNLNLTNAGNILPTNNHHNNTSGIGKGINDSINPITESSIGNTKPFDFDLFHRSAFRPQIIQATSNDENHEKKLLMSLDLTDYQPEDIKVTIKDQELIVKAERKVETDTRKSRTSFFQSTSLPPQTDVEHLQSNYIDGKLIIEAPYLDRRSKTNEQIVIESQQQSITDDPYQQRTETVIEFIRRRRL